MKKGVVILFLGLLLYNTVGFILNFQFVLAEWHKEMAAFLKQNIDEKDLIHFTFEKAEFNISTHEFSINNVFYDVVRTTVVDDKIIVYCFQDDKESQLKTQFTSIFFQNTTTEGDVHKKILRIFEHIQMEYVFENPFRLQQCPPSVLRGRKSVLSYRNPYFLDFIFDILTPPPQRVG